MPRAERLCSFSYEFPEKLGIDELKKIHEDLRVKLWFVSKPRGFNTIVVYISDNRPLIKSVLSHVLSDACSCSPGDIDFRAGKAAQADRITIDAEGREKTKPSSANSKDLFD